MDASSQAEIVRMVSYLAEGRVQPLRRARRAMIRWALDNTHGNVSQAAEMLHTSRGTVYRYVNV